MELNTTWKPSGFGVNPGGPAGSLIADMTAAGLNVIEVSGRKLAQATGMVLDGITEDTIRHSNQPVLNVAAGAAQTRTIGDAKVFDTRVSTDVSPLQACAIALFVLSTVKKKTYRSRSY